MIFYSSSNDTSYMTYLAIQKNYSQGEEDSIPVKMCGTLEYMSPEVMSCTRASSASGKF